MLSLPTYILRWHSITARGLLRHVSNRSFSSRIDPEELLKVSKKHREENPVSKGSYISYLVVVYVYRDADTRQLRLPTREGMKYAMNKEYPEAESEFQKTLEALQQDQEKFNPRVWCLVLNK